MLDVGCGTGLNLGDLRDRVGAEGRVTGIDASPEMAAIARERVARHGWANVRVLAAAIEDAEVEPGADAALFSFVHDIMQTESAIRRIVAILRPGARVASVGPKLGPKWALPANLLVRALARPYVTTFSGLERPWRLLDSHRTGLQVRPMALGGFYVAWDEIGEQGRGAARDAAREGG